MSDQPDTGGRRDRQAIFTGDERSRLYLLGERTMLRNFLHEAFPFVRSEKLADLRSWCEMWERESELHGVKGELEDGRLGAVRWIYSNLPDTDG